MSRANIGTRFYPVRYWVIPKAEKSSDTHFGGAPVTSVVPRVKDAEAAIREIRNPVERLTKDATPDTPRQADVGVHVLVTQPATIRVLRLEEVSKAVWDERLRELSAMRDPAFRAKSPAQKKAHLHRIKQVK